MFLGIVNKQHLFYSEQDEAMGRILIGGPVRYDPVLRVEAVSYKKAGDHCFVAFQCSATSTTETMKTTVNNPAWDGLMSPFVSSPNR